MYMTCNHLSQLDRLPPFDRMGNDDRPRPVCERQSSHVAGLQKPEAIYTFSLSLVLSFVTNNPAAENALSASTDVEELLLKPHIVL
ncbi:hypothetical protein TNCV_549621 [Trichonephila clavipes]|nr:hypothetical protein TNCV_549621 [Trichonephila clavipes]